MSEFFAFFFVRISKTFLLLLSVWTEWDSHFELFCRSRVALMPFFSVHLFPLDTSDESWRVLIFVCPCSSSSTSRSDGWSSFIMKQSWTTKARKTADTNRIIFHKVFRSNHHIFAEKREFAIRSNLCWIFSSTRFYVLQFSLNWLY